MDIGIENAGFHISVCVEFDKLACETIKLNTKTPLIPTDINKVTTKEILNAAGLKKNEVDLIVGGPPCQAFSTAGARRSMNDFRGNVIINYLRVVNEIRPKFFVLENVRGIYSSAIHFVPGEYGNEYDNVKNLKGSVLWFLNNEFKKMGYSINFTLFNSANYGVPQIRERLVMFGHRGERIPLPTPTHTESGIETGHKWVTIKDAFKGLNESEMDYIELSDKHKFYLKELSAGQNWKNLPKSDQKKAMGKSYGLQGGKTGFYRRLSFNKPSPTLVTSPSMPATMLAHPTKLRPLSIQEYARIQQFPDTWKFAGKIRDIYKQIGNAVPVGLGEMIGNTIKRFSNNQLPETEESNNHIPYSRYNDCEYGIFIEKFMGEAKKQAS